MDDRLGMNQNFDALQPHGEQMSSLDQFQALVHHRGAIDADLRAHRPIGMRHGLRWRYVTHLFPAARAERAATRRQDDPCHIIQAASGKALKNSIMLAIDRQQCSTRMLRCVHHQRTRRYERFFVGKGHRATRLQRRHRGTQARTANDRGHGPVRPRLCRLDQSSFARCDPDPRPLQRRL